MLDVTRLRVLVELRRHGSMAQVAIALRLTPSAVSQQLRKLEAEVRTPLIAKDGRGVRLTAAGLRLADDAERVFVALERAEAGLEAARGGRGRTHLRVGCLLTVVHAVLPDVVASLAASNPELQLHVRTYEPEYGIDALVQGDVDVLVIDEYRGVPRRRRADLQRTALGADPIRAYLPVGSEDADPAEVPWVFEPERTEAAGWSLALCRERGFEPDVRYESSDLMTHARLVEAGLAAAFLPHLVSTTVAGPLQAASGFPLDLSRQLLGVVRAGSMERPSVQQVLQAFRDSVAAALQR